MRLSGDALNVDLKVETGAAYRQLKEDHGKILEALRSQGYTDRQRDNQHGAGGKAGCGQPGKQPGTVFPAPAVAASRGRAARHASATIRRGAADGGFNGAGETNVEDTSSGACWQQRSWRRLPLRRAPPPGRGLRKGDPVGCREIRHTGRHSLFGRSDGDRAQGFALSLRAQHRRQGSLSTLRAGRIEAVRCRRAEAVPS